MKSEEITELLKLNFLDMEVYKAALFVFNKRLSTFIEDKKLLNMDKLEIIKRDNELGKTNKGAYSNRFW